MSRDEVLILTGQDVEQLLHGRDLEIVDAVARAYIAHHEGKSALPHSSFVHFPDRALSRIIALPAFLGDGFEVAGLKWISSFPENHDKGMARASAVLILNDTDSGRPTAVLEGSIISARRTAASAALGARTLLAGRRPDRVGVIGCGPIAHEIARFLRLLIGAKDFVLHDLHRGRAEGLAATLRRSQIAERTEVVDGVEAVLAPCTLVVFATTAGTPYIHDLSSCPRGAIRLNISLRDLDADSIGGCDNVVDDIDHVCRAKTSLHLAEQKFSGREFIRCPLAAILKGEAPARRDPESISVFSPFGLGVLDLALGKLALDAARTRGLGIRIPSFFPLDAAATSR